MNLDHLTELVMHGEGLTLDFKETLPGNATKIAEILSSFANCEGGFLLVGVDDDGKIIGLSEPDKVQQRLASISQSACRPPLDSPKMGSICVGNGKYVVWMEVTPLTSELCFVEGRCYTRVGPTSMPITTHQQLEAALKQKETLRARHHASPLQRVVGLRFADPNIGFKDRVEKLATLRKFLTETASVKFISILGRAGIGKTALLSKVCLEAETQGLRAREAGRFGVDGILYYSCRGTDIPLVGRLFSDIGKVLGTESAEELMEHWRDRTQSVADKIRFLLSKLSSGHYLLVVDNLESLLDDNSHFVNPDLTEFFDLALTSGHCLRILATSRRQPVVNCAAIRATRSVALNEGLPDGEAIALLREMDPLGNLGLLDESEEILLRVTSRCCGIPRALEAFAGILMADPVMTPDALLTDMKLFDVHVAENLVADHYNRLSEQEKRVVEVIALLNKPAPSEAIAYVLQPFFPDLPVEDCLRRLVRQFVVSYLRDGHLYTLHALDQQHAYARIPLNDELYNRKLLHERAATYYLEVVSQPVAECLNLTELDPRLSAFLHLRSAGNSDKACRALDELDPGPLSTWGHYQLIAELRESIKDIQGDTSLKAVNLGGLGRAYANLGETERAIECFTESIELARVSGNMPQVAMRLGNLGEAYFVLGDTDKAILHFMEAHKESCDSGDDKEAGFWLGHIGLAHMRLGQLDEAGRCFQSAVQIAADKSDRREGSWLSNLAALLLTKGETANALEYYGQAVEMARRIQDRRGLVARLRGMGYCLAALSRFDDAASKCEEALGIARSIKSRYGIAATLHSLGRIYCHAGNLRRSRVCLQESISVHSPSSEYQSCIQLGIVDLLDQRSEQATGSFEAGLSLCSTRLVKTPNDYDVIYCQATGYVGLSDFDAAQQNLCSGFRICAAVGVLQNVRLDLALLQPVSGDPGAVAGLISILDQALRDLSTASAKQASQTG